MKNLIIILLALLITNSLFAQQLPISENYFVDKFSLSSAYAGNSADKMVFASYRRDWSGLSTGPKTVRLSYNDGFKSNAGFGAKLIMDKVGIFQSMFAIGTYSYGVQLNENSNLYFGLSGGIHQNSIHFGDYYNDPNFNSDPAMINKEINSKLKVVSDFSMVYAARRFHSGILFSNVGIGDYRYSEVDVKFSPFMTYQVHANYSQPFLDLWSVTPMVIFRGGKEIPAQLEIASNIMYKDKFWGNIAHRGKTIFCVGFGMDISKGIIFNYNYNLSTDVSVSAYQNHEISLGIKLADLVNNKSIASN